MPASSLRVARVGRVVRVTTRIGQLRDAYTGPATLHGACRRRGVVSVVSAYRVPVASEGRRAGRGTLRHALPVVRPGPGPPARLPVFARADVWKKIKAVQGDVLTPDLAIVSSRLSQGLLCCTVRSGLQVAPVLDAVTFRFMRPPVTRMRCFRV